MRILFWSENFLPLVGGAEVLAARLVSALQERGHTCKVVTSLKPAHLPSKEQYNGTPVHRFPFRDSSPNIDQVVRVR